MRNVQGEGAVMRCRASELLQQNQPAKEERNWGQAQMCFQQSLQPGTDAPDIYLHCCSFADCGSLVLQAQGDLQNSSAF